MSPPKAVIDDRIARAEAVVKDGREALEAGTASVSSVLLREAIDAIVPLLDHLHHRREPRPDRCPPEVVPLLGTMVDSDLAVQIGVSSATIHNWRNHRSIPRYQKYAGRLGLSGAILSPPKVLPAWCDQIRDRLGAASDADLAREAGVSRELVRRYRASLGIAAPIYRPGTASQRPLPEEARPWFGQIPHAEIARRLRCSTSMVATWQRRHDLPPPPVARRQGSRLDAVRDLFGKAPNREIAARAGVSVAAIAGYRRRHPDLPRLRDSLSTEKKTCPDPAVLGTVSDGALAERWAVSRGTVTRWREAAGVPAFRRKP